MAKTTQNTAVPVPSVTEPTHYRVPSQNTPGTYYDVAVGDTMKETICSCRWGQNPNATSKCWHARFAGLLELAEWIVPGITEDYADQARGGQVQAQLVILRDVIESLYSRGEFQAAARAAEVLSKYLVAISVQGAAAAAPRPSRSSSDDEQPQARELARLMK